MSMWLRQEIQAVLYEKSISLFHINNLKNIEKKGSDFVVELDQFKFTLNNYEGPLEELRDSL